MLKQLTVFLENKPGRMAEVTGSLADENINLHALSIADTTDFGILRMIVSHPDRAKKILKENGCMVKTADVFAVAMGHIPGSLHKVLRELELLNISIEYMYAFTSRHKRYDAVVIFRTDDQEETAQKLENSSISVLDQELLEHLNEV